MDLPKVTHRATPVLAAVVLFVVLVAAAAPASAAPRMGITRARGLPAESAARPAAGSVGARSLTAASVTAPITQRDDYFAFPWGVAWAIGAVGAVLLLGGARGYALARRRADQAGLAGPAELPAGRPPAGERRKAA
jgi:hypothetical protein